jgi:hypothetical protein
MDIEKYQFCVNQICGFLENMSPFVYYPIFL